MTGSNDTLPETAAAADLQRHLARDCARTRRTHPRLAGARGGAGADSAYRPRRRTRDRFPRRGQEPPCPEYLLVHGLPPEAANETLRELGGPHPPRGPRTHRVRHLFEVLKGESEDYTAVYRIIRPNDGESRWIRVAAKIERDGQRPRVTPCRRRSRHHRPDAGAGNAA